MAGLISVGQDYSNKALSGFVRQTADQQKINEANREMEEADKQQRIRNNVTAGTSAALSTALLIATLLG